VVRRERASADQVDQVMQDPEDWAWADPQAPLSAVREEQAEQVPAARAA
jgi:hypothetical protein